MAWVLYALLVLGVLSNFSGALSAVESSERSGYLVRLRSAPSVAQRAKSSPSLFPRVAGSPQKINFHSRASLSHAAGLTRSHVSTLLKAGIAEGRLIYSYTVLVNGFSAALTEAEVEALRRDPAVGHIEKSRLLRLHTTHTPAFLNLPNTLWKASGGDANAGEGLVIGVIDTGISIESPAFADNTSKPYGAPPKYWRGKCQVTKDFPKCNKKVIGARFFSGGFETQYGAISTEDYVSPRDANGHGTHVASTAGGNHGYPINFLGVPIGKASGMAPRARLAAYKVAWMAAGSSDATAATDDIVAALDQAVADGVDVINYSLGGGPPDFFADEAISFLLAADAGVLVSCSAGNSGRERDQLTSGAPWVLTVAASTHDRGDYINGVKLQTGKAYSGAGFTVGTGAKLLPLIYAGDAARTSGSASAAKAALCLRNTLNPSKVKGKIVICVHSQAGGDEEKGDVVRAAGGIGMVLANDAASGKVLVYNNVYSLPAVHVTYVDGQAMIKYARTKSPQGSITGVTAPLGLRAPALADFSTRGPLSSTAGNVLNYVLKPDVAGPGVDIWAAWPGGEANMLSGTSMAAPHLAGLAALIKQKHPDWSVFAIKSAISTTASTLDNKKLPIRDGSGLATPFGVGSGQINTAGVLDPGLVYDSSILEMVLFLLEIDEDKTLDYFDLPAGKKAIKPYDLNVPNIAAPALVRTLTFKRVVKSVATSVSTYKAAVVAPAGVSVKVEPSSFTISPGKYVTYRVTFTVTSATSTWSFGSLTWTDGKHSVRSVLAAQPVRK